MVDIRFYHLQEYSTEQALPMLIEKTLQRDLRSLVIASSEHRLSQLSQALWTFRDDSFLPHGTISDPYPEKQPVLLSTEIDNLNESQILFLTDRADFPAQPDQFTIIATLFDHRDQEAVQRARTAWKTLKDDHQLTYWQQISNKWVKQAETTPKSHTISDTETSISDS